LVEMETSPKLQRNPFIYPQSKWYQYYAGFSDAFVKELFEKYCVQFNSPTILDPWNGSGTTTLVASMLGYSSYGFDLNPVMVIVARAKLFSPTQKNISDLLEKIQYSNITNKRKISYDQDPLNRWFVRSTVTALRKIEAFIQKYCFKTDNVMFLCNAWDYQNISNELAFYYLALFSMLKDLAKTFITSNPTWIKSNIEESQKIKLSWKELFLMFSDTLIKMGQDDIKNPININCNVAVANSQNIPLNDRSVDIIISSPPYCTRIDYAIYTQIELALLGYDKDRINLLRQNMIGTPTITNQHNSNVIQPDSLCGKTLSAIANHESKAAKSYYYKTYLQYFDSMNNSIKELYRVLSSNGLAILVVQDSWFKDIYIDLPDILTELCSMNYLVKLEMISFNANNNMNYINTKSAKYKTKRAAKECVIIFGKGESHGRKFDRNN